MNKIIQMHKKYAILVIFLQKRKLCVALSTWRRALILLQRLEERVKPSGSISTNNLFGVQY